MSYLQAALPPSRVSCSPNLAEHVVQHLKTSTLDRLPSPRTSVRDLDGCCISHLRGGGRPYWGDPKAGAWSAGGANNDEQRKRSEVWQQASRGAGTASKGDGFGSAIMRGVTESIAREQLRAALTERLKSQITGKIVQTVKQEAQKLALQKKMDRADNDDDDNRNRNEEDGDDDELERIRERRVLQMQRQATLLRMYKALGHGSYEEVDEQGFFARCRRSTRVVLHFFRPSTIRCKVLDGHLSALAAAHPEALFIKINAEKAPFLTTKMHVRVLPCVKLLRRGAVVHTMLGFDELGARDDFKTGALERLLRARGVLLGRKIAGGGGGGGGGGGEGGEEDSLEGAEEEEDSAAAGLDDAAPPSD